MMRRVGFVFAALLFGCTDEAATEPPPYPGPSRGFTEVFAATGIQIDASGNWPFPRMGPVNAAALADCDSDGRPDAYVFGWNGHGTLWRNLGDLRFERAETPPGLEGIATAGAAFGDLDNDGRPDLVTAHGVEAFVRAQRENQGRGPIGLELRVYRNLGACRFEDVSAAWGFGAFRTDDAAMFAGVDLGDINLDGRLDLVTRHSVGGASQVRAYLSRPDGTWAESLSELMSPTAEPLVGSNWTNFFHDVDDDGLIDLFVLFDEYQGPPARFLRRASARASHPYVDETFDPRIFAPEYNRAGLMGAASGDVDGDGFLDLYILDLGPQHLYLHRSGRMDVAVAAGVQLPILERSETPTVAFGASFADYDNDTWPDLAVAVGVTDGFYEPPNAVLFHNRGNGTFENVTPLLHQTGTFTSFWMTGSDLDRDGRVDYWMGGSASPPRVWRNEMSAGRSFAVRLRGHTSNAEGVGAKVTARLGARALVQEMQSGGSPWGYGEHRLVFGIGRARAVDNVEVRWPSGYVQRIGTVQAGAEVVIEEPELLRLDARVVSVGASVTVTVRPATPSGALLGAGHRVEVVMIPGDVALAVADNGAGEYTARAPLTAAGLYGFTARIDGVALLAHPQVIAR